MSGGSVCLFLCGRCHRRYEAMKGIISWLPVLVPPGERKPKLPLPINPVSPTMWSGETVPPTGSPMMLMVVTKQGTALMSNSTVDLAKLRCPDCGTTYLDFRRTGRLGCPYDYVVFRSGLLPLLDRVQRAKQHRGKRPRILRETIEDHGEIRGLRLRLKQAVEAEDYVQASQIRDLIRSKERQNGS